MGNWSRHTAAALVALAAACGGGSGGSGGSGGDSGNGSFAGASFGVVELISYTPSDGAVQVPLAATITLEFDAEMAMETFAHPETWLREASTQQLVPVTFKPAAGRRVQVQPQSPLEAETDYTFQLAALTTDVNGRILDRTTSFTFRTFDETPPTLVSFDVPNNATGVQRSGAFTLQFDEGIAQDSIDDQTLYLRDIFGFRYPCDTTAVGDTVVLQPHADLPGDRQFFVIVTTAVTDRAGNALAAPFQSTFTTVTDADDPSTTAAWPAQNATGISPLVQPTFRFDESMDPDSVEATSLIFQDEFNGLVAFTVEATMDQRTLRIIPSSPLQPNRSYELSFLLGGVAATDVSGNTLTATQTLTFTTGSDYAPPKLVESTPDAGEARVPGALVATMRYDEPLDPAWVDAETVQLLVDDAPWTSVVELIGGDTVQVTPILAIPTDTACRLVLRGGQDGLRDLAGNVPADATVTFTTSGDSGRPEALLLPPDDASAVATGSCMSVSFDAPMDPATLNSATVQFTDDAGAPLVGDFVVSGGDRVVTFTPTAQLTTGEYYRIRVVGGDNGPRRVTGNWFESDRTSRFRVGALVDGVAPTVTATINDLPEARRSGLVLPPFGWSVDINATDAQDQWVDLGSVEVVFDGGAGPTPSELLAVAQMGPHGTRIVVPDSAALPPGSWTMRVRVADLSGNVGESNVIAFEVDDLSTGAMPFERTQVVWVRTELDRNNNGRGDFSDDMLRLGLQTEGDPNGSNAWLEQVLLEGILAKANQLYGRGARGEPLDEGSVPLRFTIFEPISLPHMQMGLGGLDPEGGQSRQFGQESTGVLGRAFYDYRNSNVAERNTTSSPGTGVFPAEMFLYQARTHLQVYPAFQTVFASRFLPLCPDMGGTPAGSHPLDATVLRPDFDYATATGSERARWTTVMEAMDDWAAVIGVILAHEVGHSVGLVAPGDMPLGLFGDSSLHNTFAGAAEVMASSVGYEAMTSLDYRFRDLDLAYLRQQVLLR